MPVFLLLGNINSTNLNFVIWENIFFFWYVLTLYFLTEMSDGKIQWELKMVIITGTIVMVVYLTFIEKFQHSLDPLSNNTVCTIINPVLQMERLTPRRMKQLAIGVLAC